MAMKFFPQRVKSRAHHIAAFVNRTSGFQRSGAWTAVLLVFLAAALSVISGCGGASYPVVGAITYPNGSPSGVAPGGTVSLSAMITNDSRALGVDWLATCTPPTSTVPVTSSTSTLCGTFAPAHTASGAITNFTAPFAIPTGGTVTITATATADPTRTATTSVTISGQPITVTITPSAATVEVNQNISLSANVANDPANTGVIWTLSCDAGDTGPDCGGFSAFANGATTNTIKNLPGSPVTYYAPATPPAGTVLLTATSVTNPQVASTVQVTVVPTITVSFLSPPPAFLAFGASTSLTAILVNDYANAGVTWTATAGSFSAAQTASGVATVYTAPADASAGSAVTVTATSVTDPTATVSATITLGTNISVGISTAPLSIQTGGTASFAATVFNDAANGGVMWTASAGSFSQTVTASGVATTYTAPATVPNGATVTVTATSVTDPTKSASATVAISQAPAITVSVTPPTATVQASGTATFYATVANDPSNAGVTWSAPVGTFSSLQATSNPAITSVTYTAPTAVPTGGTVTITATSVANKSISGTATVTVGAAAIQVTISPATATVQTSGTVSFTATVANDSANGGVTWKASTGSFTPAQTASGTAATYTAPTTVPTSGTVTLTATSVTDPTKSATATVAITATPPPIAVTLVNPPSTLQTGGTATFEATLANDKSNGGVKWTATAGTFNPTQTASGASTTYTAPATVPGSGTVTITATSVTDPTKSATATVAVAAPSIMVTLSPAPATLQAGTAGAFTATVTNDNANSGVDWTATAGSFTSTQTASGVASTYTAPDTVPSGGTVTITATSVTDPTKSATATVTITPGVGNSLLNGKYVFAMTGQYGGEDNPGLDTQYEGYIGSFTADGNGNITGGDVDFVNASLNDAPESFTALTGSYSIQPNGHGSITINGGNATVGTYSFTMSVVLSTQSHGLVMSTVQDAGTLASGDLTGGVLSGTVDKQTAASFTTPLSGNYAFTYEQVFAGNEPDNLGGIFTVQNGTIKKTVLEENAGGIVASGTYSGSNTFSSPDSNGRGTITLTNFGMSQSGNKFIYYIVDSTHFVFIPTVENQGGGLGAAYLQPATLPASMAGPFAFTEAGWIFPYPTPLYAVDSGGVFTCDSSGNLTSGTLDVNNGGTFASAAITAGSCSTVAADGRGTINFTSTNSDVVASFAVYPTAGNGWLMLELDPNASGVGAAYTQAADVSAAALAGSYASAFQSYDSNASNLTTLLGPITANGTAALSGTLDLNVDNNVTLGASATGKALADTGGGRFTGDINTTPTGDITQVFYVVDANLVLTLESDNGYEGVGVMQLQSLETP